MDQRKKKLFSRLVVNAVLITGIFVSALVFSTVRGGATTQDFEDSAVLPKNWLSAETDTSTIFLPVVMKNYPWISPFGVETLSYLTDGSILLQRTSDLDARWVRLNGKISWRDLQPNEGDKIDDETWEQLSAFEAELRALKSAGITPIIIVDDSPHWATIYPSSCAAISEDKFDAFADFMRQLVQRYSAAEYNVHHWELGNEPDIDPKFVPVDNFYGCWGDVDDPYYGGRHYGNMLKSVTPVIKAADSSASVWIGGLLLDNPNTTDPYYGRPELFLEGILAAGAGPYFDIVGYHAYMGFNNQIVDQDNGVVTSSWYSLGGSVLGKAKFLQQTLDRYGIQKPLFVNEFALNCPGYCALGDTFWQMQASQLVRSMVRGVSNGLMGFAWFTLDGPGWRNGGLLDSNQAPRLAYDAYQQLTKQLRSSKYSRVVDYGPGIEAYEYLQSTTVVHVVWAEEDENDTIEIPELEFIEARELDGILLNPSLIGGTYRVPISFDPVYIILKR